MAVQIKGPANLLSQLEGGKIPYSWVPECIWECIVTADDVVANGTHVLTLTIPSAGLVDGEVSLRLLGTDQNGDAVDVTVTALFDTDEDGTATALEAAIQTARGTTLADTVASESVTDNVVTVTMLAGVHVVPTFTYTPAQTADAVWSGTLQNDASYIIDIDGVPTEVIRTGGSPADVAAMAVAMEAALEANASLSGILASADDDSTDTNALVFDPGIDTATITAQYVGRVQTWTNTVGGTATDGDYTLSFVHSSLPDIDGDNQVNVTVTRSTTPATNADIAAAFEAAIEANPHLAALVASADDSSNVNTIVAAEGVTGLEVAVVAAPAPGTLTVEETTPTITITDTTPAGPTLVATNTLAVSLNALHPKRKFPTNVHRLKSPEISVTEAWPANTTADLGDTGDPDGVLAGVDITTTGLKTDSGTAEGDGALPETDWSPIATFTVSNPTSIASGRVVFAVDFRPFGAM